MAYCPNCGAEVSPNQDVCLKCGKALRSTTVAVNDNGGFGWGLLGFCIPVVGLILFLVWREERPITAKAAGVGALVSVVAGVAIGIIYFIIIAALLSSAGY